MENTPSFRKALFPLIMAAVSLLLFTAVYTYLIKTSVEPRYAGYLIFALPFVCFGIVAVFAARGKLATGTASVLTGVLIPVFAVVVLLAAGYFAIKEATTVTTDVGKYERVLKLTGYPQNRLTEYYPAEIPGDATNVLFSYNPAFGMGGEDFELRFDTDRYGIESYIAAFSRLAAWEGKASSPDAGENGIFLSTFTVSGYSMLPDDFTVYLLDGEPYQPGDWNHGRLSLVAVSRRRGEIIFHAEDW